MCGRFSRDYSLAEIRRMYSLVSTPANIQPNFNVCPTQTVDIVRDDDESAVLKLQHRSDRREDAEEF